MSSYYYFYLYFFYDIFSKFEYNFKLRFIFDINDEEYDFIFFGMENE